MAVRLVLLPLQLLLLLLSLKLLLSNGHGQSTELCAQHTGVLFAREVILKRFQRARSRVSELELLQSPESAGLFTGVCE